MGTEFSREQFDAIYPKGIENHYWTFARNKVLAHILSKNNRNSNILEIGCGKGVVVEYLLKKGFNISGVELADVPVEEHLREKVRANVDVFSLPGEEKKKVDTVMLLDVIEHIEFPKPFIEKIVREFPNLRTFIITVPACQELFSNYDVFNGHFRRYSPETLLNEFDHIGVKKTMVGYFFHSLYIPGKILLNTKGKRSEKIIAPMGVSKILHALIANCFFLEFLCLPSRLKGTSLVLKVDLK